MPSQIDDQYDPAGAVTQSAVAFATGITTASYDAAGRLTALAAPGSPTASYTYDALGRLATRTIGGTTDTATYAGASATLVRDAGASTSDLLDLPGLGPLSESVAGVGAWLLSDLHGDVVGSASVAYTAFGDVGRTDAAGSPLVPVANPSGSPPLLGYQSTRDLVAGAFLVGGGATLIAIAGAAASLTVADPEDLSLTDLAEQGELIARVGSISAAGISFGALGLRVIGRPVTSDTC